MMNRFIKRELNKCAVAKVESLSNNEFIIHKDVRELPLDLEINHFYEIEVEDYILNPFDGFTLHDNWNHGVKPTSKNMQIEIDNIIGKMVHVKALGSDGSMWSGWLPKKSITIKKTLM